MPAKFFLGFFQAVFRGRIPGRPTYKNHSLGAISPEDNRSGNWSKSLRQKEWATGQQSLGVPANSFSGVFRPMSKGGIPESDTYKLYFVGAISLDDRRSESWSKSTTTGQHHFWATGRLPVGFFSSHSTDGNWSRSFFFSFRFGKVDQITQQLVNRPRWSSGNWSAVSIKKAKRQDLAATGQGSMVSGNWSITTTTGQARVRQSHGNWSPCPVKKEKKKTKSIDRRQLATRFDHDVQNRPSSSHQ